MSSLFLAITCFLLRLIAKIIAQMEHLIGRQKEIKKLRQYASSPKSEFLII